MAATNMLSEATATAAPSEPTASGRAGPPAGGPAALEDWWAVWLGFTVLLLAAAGLVSAPEIAAWVADPRAAFATAAPVHLAALLVGLGAGMTVAVAAMGNDARGFATGFPAVFALALAAHVAGRQETVYAYGFGYVIWALVLGLVISNILGVPSWLRAAARTELFIKTGLVLLGAEILFTRMLALGVPGLGVAWLVTPVVFSFMYFFGTRTLGMQSKSLTATISAATSVCGVSAAIAIGAATRAKREEISYTISLTLLFTVGMMLLMPALARLLGLDQSVGGAWIGGTVDSTGAVVASGAILGAQAMEVAAVVKMIQNILIGVLAFVVAVLWVTRVDRGRGEAMPGLMDIWTRFPKFIVGFVCASLFFSFVLSPALGTEGVAAILKVTKGFRAWFFALAFVSIGIESNFRELMRVSGGGAPVLLYFTGQTFNIVLTLAAAWWFFGTR